MSKRRIYRACLAWMLAICMVFSGSAWTSLTAYAEGAVTVGDEKTTVTDEKGESGTGEATETGTGETGKTDDSGASSKTEVVDETSGSTTDAGTETGGTGKDDDGTGTVDKSEDGTEATPGGDDSGSSEVRPGEEADPGTGEGEETGDGEEGGEEVEKITITFNYGLNESDLNKADYTVDDITYSNKVEVEKGVSWGEVQSKATLPSYNLTMGRMNFSDWSFDDGNYISYDDTFDKDTTVVAHWTHTITYHAGEGHFFGGEKDGIETRSFLSENDTLLDISLCCYPAEGTTRAFIGWGVKISGELVPVYDLLNSQFAVYENTDLYAMYTDGYPVTFDVNLDGGSIRSFYESYRDSDGYRNYNYTSRSLTEDNVKTVTFTYPLGVKPSEANYFCSDPFYSSSCLDKGDNAVMFGNWSKDIEGRVRADYYSLTPAGDGSDVIYAIWKDYWVVTYDPNGKGYNSSTTETVIKGSTISYMPTFEYSDDTGSYVVASFNTKADGSGDKIDYNYIPTSNVTVYAQYKGIYNIYLDGNGGSVDYYYRSYQIDRGEEFKSDLKDILVIWPDKEDEQGNTIRSRKVLKEWRTNSDGTGETPAFTPTADTTLYAIPEDGWLVTFHTGAVDGDEDNEYGTIFSFRDKSNVTDASFAYSKTKPMGSVPYLSTYINEENKRFAGWSTEYGDASKIINEYEYTPTEDTDLYAIWYDLVPITYHANGGEFSRYYGEKASDTYVDRVIKGESFTPYGAVQPSLDKYVFSGWTEREGSTKNISAGAYYKATEAMDFYATWEPGHTITLDGNGGNIHYMSHSGQEYYGDGSKAIFTIKMGSPVLEKIEYDGEDEYESEHGQVSGWREDGKLLAGWSKEKNGEKIDLYSYIPTGDETFYAIWEDPCTVNYDPDGGYINDYEKNAQVLKGGHVPYLPAPTAADKYFVGWFMEDGTTRFDVNTVVTGDIIVTARWSDEMVTVTFDAGEGASINNSSLKENTQSVAIAMAKGALLDMRSYKPRRDDSSNDTFGGWKADGYTWDVTSSDRYYEVKDDISFTAIWNKVAYCNVTFEGNGGYVVDSENADKNVTKVTFNDKQVGKAIGVSVFAEQEGKEFTGWYLEPECTNFVATGENIATFKPAGDITLYAGWKEEEKIPVKDITLSKDKVSLGVTTTDGKTEADTYTLKAVVYPANATNGAVTFESSNSEVATVSASGKITAVKEGTATITVKSVENEAISKTCKVTVNSITTKAVNDTLTKAAADMADATKEAAKTTLDTALAAMGNTDTEKAGAEKLAEMVVADEAVAKTLAKLEEAYVDKAEITVEKPAENNELVGTVAEAFGLSKEESKGNLDVSGAGLNAKPEETIGLSVSAVEESEEKEIDDKFEKAVQVDINLTATSADGDKREIEELDAPVTLTLPIPSGMIRSKLYVLHFNEETGSYEIIRPTFKNNSMSFTVSHFSRFAFVELAETISQSGGSEETPEPTPEPTPTPTPTPATGGKQGTPATTEAPTSSGTTDTSSSTGTTDTPVAQTVTDGATVSEAGSTASYTVSSATDKTVAYTGDTSSSGKVTVKSTITVGSDTYTVTSIADGAFKKSKITAVTIPATVESIGKSAFEGSTKLKTLTIKGSKLTSIGDSAFKGCTALTKVTLPKSIKTVGKNAFANCKKLKTVTVKNKKMKFAKNSLKGVPKTATVKLPKMTAKEKKAYKKMLKNAGFKGKVK